MAQPARRRSAVGEPPPQVDPATIESAFSYHRARRKSLIEHRRQRRRARIRFWVVLAVLATASVYLAIVVWHQVQSLFGL